MSRACKQANKQPTFCCNPHLLPRCRTGGTHPHLLGTTDRDGPASGSGTKQRCPFPSTAAPPLKGESRVRRGLHPLARTNKLSFRDQIADLNEEKGGGEEEDPVPRLAFQAKSYSGTVVMEECAKEAPSCTVAAHRAARPGKCMRLVDVHE